MSRTAVPVAVLLLSGSSGAFALQNVGVSQQNIIVQPAKKPSAAQLAGQQVVQHHPPIGAIAGQYTPPPPVCIEGPCANTNQSNQANPTGNNAATNATNIAANEAQGNNSAETSPVTNNEPVIDDKPRPHDGNNLPLIIAAIAVLGIIATAVGIALHRHNILVKTRGLLSLRTKLVQPTAPGAGPVMQFAWPPLSIRARLEGGDGHG